MLQFIVLGFIPGTHIQITFAWLLIFVLGVLWSGYIAFHYQQVLNVLKTPINFRYFNPLINRWHKALYIKFKVG